MAFKVDVGKFELNRLIPVHKFNVSPNFSVINSFDAVGFNVDVGKFVLNVYKRLFQFVMLMELVILKVELQLNLNR